VNMVVREHHSVCALLSIEPNRLLRQKLTLSDQPNVL